MDCCSIVSIPAAADDWAAREDSSLKLNANLDHSLIDAKNKVPFNQRFYQAAYKSHIRLWQIVWTHWPSFAETRAPANPRNRTPEAVGIWHLTLSFSGAALAVRPPLLSGYQPRNANVKDSHNVCRVAKGCRLQHLVRKQLERSYGCEIL